MKEGIASGFRRVTARKPTADEEKILGRVRDANLEQFRKNPEAARKLISAGESKPDSQLDAAELAAMTTVASLILNLDETVTKE